MSRWRRLAALGLIAGAAIPLGCSGGSRDATTLQERASGEGEYADYCAGEPRCAAGSVPEALRRPLELPRLSPGDACPTSSSRHVSPAFAEGLGPGPVFPVGLRAGHLRIEVPPFSSGHQFAGSRWGGAKVLWVADPEYEGPILIRGARLDGPQPVRFDREPATLLPELQLPPGYTANHSGGWRNFPSHTRLLDPGCYAYQVDGTGFSYALVFLAQAP